MHPTAPPPPYSETDVNSPSVLASTASNTFFPTPPASPSIDDSPTYTPQYTPTTSVNHEHDHAASESAAAYFDTRPYATRVSGPPIIYTICITSSPEPKDLLFPQGLFESKDVTSQDWATFVNYLLPDHDADVNSQVADRKLEAELIDKRMHQLTLNQVDAQLDSLKSPRYAAPQCSPLDKATATIFEWNGMFFEPRGIKIKLVDAEDNAVNEDHNKPTQIPYDRGLEGGPAATNGKRRGWGFGGVRADSRGFKMGPIEADNEGFRIGKNGIVADNKGFRIGNLLVADNNGFSFGPFVADSRGLTVAGRSFGRRDSQEAEKLCGRHSHHHRGHHHRGRGAHTHGRHGRQRGRSSSSSSESSTSSSSSSDSDSSLGSLPDYDDLKDQQLPIAKQSLMDWLNHPDQPITRESVHNIRQEIKIAKKGNSAPMNRDALRKEVKELMREFRDRKKAQNFFRRNVRKEKRAIKKAERKERRNSKKAEKLSRKYDRKGKGRMENEHFPRPFLQDRTALSRSTSTPFPAAPFGRNRHPPNFALHGGWPFTQQQPYEPGSVSVPNLGGFSSTVSRGAEKLHARAIQMEENAKTKEAKAIDLRTFATGRRVGEKGKLKMIDEATTLEEEAEICKREAEKLRTEALHLDSELAGELEEKLEGQVTGVISH